MIRTSDGVVQVTKLGAGTEDELLSVDGSAAAAHIPSSMVAQFGAGAVAVMQVLDLSLRQSLEESTSAGVVAALISFSIFPEAGGSTAGGEPFKEPIRLT